MSVRKDSGSGPESVRRSPARTSVDNAVEAAKRYLIATQAADGHWVGELEGDTILESEYILTMHFLGRTGEERIRKTAEHLRRKQLPSGGWAIYEGGPAEVSSSVKAYFVLKLMGDDPNAPHMVRARETILSLGGIEACNSFTRIYLAIFGQCSWDDTPAVPPEIVLLPDRFIFNIYKMSSWSRGIVVPLSIIWAAKPFCPVPDFAAIQELRVGHAPAAHVPRSRKERSWRRFFTRIDHLLKRFEAAGFTPLRQKALEACEAWIHERLARSDGLGAIFPPIINTIIAFRCLGYALDDPRLLAQVRELEKLELEDEETLHVQPCFSPIWDTALVIEALSDAGVPADDTVLLKAGRWLLDREVKEVGDWKKACPAAEPGGWYFEYANEWYPDTDDTAEVLTALSRVRFPGESEDLARQGAVARGQAWMLAMQNRDGGWGAFDKDCDNEVLTYIPFADHNAMIDPSCEDITGRALEAFHSIGVPAGHPAVRRAAAFLDAKQLPDGTWYGRWGCNYLYGSFLALRGLLHAGEDLRQPRFQQTADWIRSCQNPDGGWGELPLSYDDPKTKGQGPSTPSQTAWALTALFATGDRDSEAVRRGVDYLLANQQYDGSWKDDHWTATGFPKVFYLRYHLYATVFPLRALALYTREASVNPRGRMETGADALVPRRTEHGVN
ncbi:MAG TPA: squalene--hopene cyclase [Thermoanaerobaculia bacterium]|nr:squalene--hopene cyclase [Thermoanaerobaculia bacterium]